MNRLEIVNYINSNTFEDNKKKLIELLNDLFNSGEYSQYLDLVFSLIRITEMYGFLAYFNTEEREKFLKWDSDRSQAYEGFNLEFYNNGQLSLLYELSQHKKAFVSASTSFGKTSIVIEFILGNFNELKNIVFIVPTNSLLEELYLKLIFLNKKFELNYRITTQPKITENLRNFLLLTPERFLILCEQYSIDFFDYIMMDETYKIVDSKNEKVSDFIDERSYRFRKVADIVASSSKRVIFLSPFTYELTESMNKFLKKFDIKKIDRELEYVHRKIYNVSNHKNFIENFESNEKYKKNFPKSKKASIILKKLKDKKNIVYVSSYKEAYKIVDEIISENFSLKNERFNKFISHLEENYKIDNKFEWKIITALKKGVGIYISPLPRYIKREIVKLYEENILKILIVTTAFTEGVNTNASNLIFSSLTNGPNNKKLSDIDVLNVAGRAGRFAKNSVGKVYCLTDECYKKVNDLQERSKIYLENYNYKIFDSSMKRNQYEIDMISDEFLNEEERKNNEKVSFFIEKLKLSKRDLNISLNVPSTWKLILYSSINYDNIDDLYNSCVNLLDVDSSKRVESLEYVFKFIRNSFLKNEITEDINPFSTKKYEIKPFDNSNEFIWGRLYAIYCSGNISKVIENNIKYIKKIFYELKNKSLIIPENKKDLYDFFYDRKKAWILNYFNDDLTLNYDSFYTETFKFISNVIQYKIPFYVSFVTSIVNLYIRKNNFVNKYNLDKLDSKKFVILFENGNYSEEYDALIDYGISNDVIMKINKNKISFKDLLEKRFDKTIFDEYELLIIEEFLLII